MAPQKIELELESAVWLKLQKKEGNEMITKPRKTVGGRRTDGRTDGRGRAVERWHCSVQPCSCSSPLDFCSPSALPPSLHPSLFFLPLHTLMKCRLGVRPPHLCAPWHICRLIFGNGSTFKRQWQMLPQPYVASLMNGSLIYIFCQLDAAGA